MGHPAPVVLRKTQQESAMEPYPTPAKKKRTSMGVQLAIGLPIALVVLIGGAMLAMQMLNSSNAPSTASAVPEAPAAAALPVEQAKTVSVKDMAEQYKANAKAADAKYKD